MARILKVKLSVVFWEIEGKKAKAVETKDFGFVVQKSHPTFKSKFVKNLQRHMKQLLIDKHSQEMFRSRIHILCRTMA